jgi:hypothetical protein
MLSNVEDVAFDRADNLYVLDRGNQRVLVFDRSGRFVRQLGKKGDGPGEFQLPRSMAVMSDGSIGVLDVIHRNISIFAADGTFRRTVPWEPEWGLPFGNIEAHPAGGVIGVLRPAMNLETVRAGNSTSRAQTFARIPLSRGGEIERLFDIPDAGTVQERSSAPAGQRQQVRMRVAGPPEFSARTLWGVLPDGGTALSHTSLYTLKIQDPSGKTVRFLQRPVPVRRTTENDRVRARQRMRERMKSGEGMISVTIGGGGGRAAPRAPAISDEQIEERVQQLEFADTIRTIQTVVVSPSGKLWIERTAADPFANGPIDIVTPQGEYIGTLRGQNIPLAISANGRAAYLERDDEGVERIVLRQLPRGWY